MSATDQKKIRSPEEQEFWDKVLLAVLGKVTGNGYMLSIDDATAFADALLISRRCRRDELCEQDFGYTVVCQRPKDHLGRCKGY